MDKNIFKVKGTYVNGKLEAKKDDIKLYNPDFDLIAKTVEFKNLKREIKGVFKEVEQAKENLPLDIKLTRNNKIELDSTLRDLDEENKDKDLYDLCSLFSTQPDFGEYSDMSI